MGWIMGEKHQVTKPENLINQAIKCVRYDEN